MIAILYSWVYSSQFNPAKNIKEIVKFILGYTVITLAVIIWMNFSRIDIFLFQGVLFSLFTFMISGIFYFGEEYGWRGYLPARKRLSAYLLYRIIWGFII